MRREFFNVMANEGKVADWIEAFTYGKAKATGPSQYLKLIVNVIDKHQERERLKSARRALLTGRSSDTRGFAAPKRPTRRA